MDDGDCHPFHVDFPGRSLLPVYIPVRPGAAGRMGSYGDRLGVPGNLLYLAVPGTQMGNGYEQTAGAINLLSVFIRKNDSHADGNKRRMKNYIK